ncbi:MAG: hypothetical protein ACRCYI_10485, partial [Plesiomonas shigelloides]
ASGQNGTANHCVHCHLLCSLNSGFILALLSRIEIFRYIIIALSLAAYSGSFTAESCILAPDLVL